MRQPNPEGVICGNFLNKHLWEFFVSLMDIFDQPKREAQIFLWEFLSH